MIPPSVLYDKDGNVVGAEVPQLITGERGGFSDYEDCRTEEGFSGGDFKLGRGALRPAVAGTRAARHSARRT